MRKITRSTILPAPAAEVWDRVQRSATLAHVSRPLLVFDPVDGPLPEVWSEGTYPVRMRLYGILPLGRQNIVIRHEPSEPGRWRIRDAGHGPLARRWDHLITIEAVGDRTRYTDRVEIDAGWLTLPVAAFAWLFYGHRQRRWRRLLRDR